MNLNQKRNFIMFKYLFLNFIVVIFLPINLNLLIIVINVHSFSLDVAVLINLFVGIRRVINISVNVLFGG